MMRALDVNGWQPRAAAVAFLLIVLGVLSPATGARAAHAEYTGATPEAGAELDAAPDTVTLSFSDPVEPVPGAYTLHTADGVVASDLAATSSGTDLVITLPEDLPNGAYALEWRAESSDGHALADTLRFAVNAPSLPFPVADDNATVQPWLSIVQAIGYITLLVAVGLPWFQVFISRQVEPGAVRASAIAGAVSAIAHTLVIPLHSAAIAGEPATAILDRDMWSVGTLDPTVRAVTFILFGVAAIVIALRRGLPGRLGRWAVALGGLVALGSMTIVGHTAEIPPTWTMHGADFVHGVVAATWFGGLVGLGAYLRRARRDGATEAATAASVVARFSFVAGLVLLGLAVSGIIMANGVLDSWDALRNSDYGRRLIVKLVVVAIVVALGAWNRVRLVPAIDGEPAGSAAWGRLHRVVTAEAALITVILLITSLLVFSNPTA
jgi:copper transport protein